ncbi:hypothetical protein Q4603_05780 [Zobellia galactanivorans]|uniref:hypothetical protein n=1 Tax=Zobellia galactanivorans (strain DSM 12802 / CCUG 47099 / CIP 106680 / NCIMB 13871 / Dsij) TaxID=63186 RepID=UPI0026E1AC25|nr:hypothetical protein [Zobellia galactanivorans]MDO6808105.1 hypothetical protein [Zobellia galactanivorans]
MTLSFSRQINGNPTYFMEKIWKGLKHLELCAELADASTNHGFDWDVFGECPPKLHTIRWDKSDRWKAGNAIHMVINNRTPNRFQFLPEIKCTHVQAIEIKHINDKVDVYIDGNWFGDIWHHGLDDVYGYTESIEVLAINDGFDSVEGFLQWFNEDFTGKIIHWHEIKYNQKTRNT